MTEPEKRIDEIEAKAAESELIGRLATDPEVRSYNRRLAIELREYAEKLRSGLLYHAQNQPSKLAFEVSNETSEVSDDGRDEEKRPGSA